MRLRAEGYAFQNQGDIAGAQSSYLKAIQADRTYATPHNDLGVVLEDQGKLAEAEQSYLQALKLNPGYPEAHANIAMLYERLGDQEKAMHHWLKRYQLGDPEQAGTLRAKERLESLGAFMKAKPQLASSANPDAMLLGGGESKAASAASIKSSGKTAPIAAAKPAEPEKPAQARTESNPLLSGFMSINEGIETTAMPTVRLKISAQGLPNIDAGRIAKVQYSNDGSSYTTPEALSSVKPWLVTPGDGIKTVYAQLLDKDNKPVARLFDRVSLDTSPLAVYVGSSQGDARERAIGRFFEANNQSEREFQAVTGEQGGWP